MNENKRTNRTFYIIKYSFIYILYTGFITVFLGIIFTINPYLTTILFGAIDLLIVRYIVLKRIEKDEECRITLKGFEKPFLIITSLAIIFITYSTQFHYINIMLCVIVHIIIFKLSDLRNERKRKKANEEIDIFFKKHPEINRRDK